jgi:drug/metabolite transporter (DMT)-like permease
VSHSTHRYFYAERKRKDDPGPFSLCRIYRFNYPNFLNLFANFMYIPICFAYIIPVARYGLFNNAISIEQVALPKRPFMIMGALDCLAASMQVFASVYLPGPLLVLLPQTAIPISMILSRYMLHERYHWTQYLGAVVVLAGIGVVLEPVISHRNSPDFYCEAINAENDCTICQIEVSEDSCLSHRTDEPLYSAMSPILQLADMDDGSDAGSLCHWLPSGEAKREKEVLMFVWSLVMIASCLPMTLSTVYKQIALGGVTNVDPVYLNGWIAIFQFFFSLILAVPAGMVSYPSISPLDMPRNVWNGILCYTGHGSVETGCHPDSFCSSSALFVNICLVANVFYTFFMMYVLKYGSSALLFLALTVMVPSKCERDKTWCASFCVRPNPPILHFVAICSRKLGLCVAIHARGNNTALVRYPGIDCHHGRSHSLSLHGRRRWIPALSPRPTRRK